MNFAVTPLRFEIAYENAASIPPGYETNALRGGLGANLRQIGCHSDCPDSQHCPYERDCVYARFFDPRWNLGPSGYRDAPRPFVLRRAGPLLKAENHIALDLFLFEINPALQVIERAIEAAIGHWRGAKLIGTDRTSTLCLPIEGVDAEGDLRVEFSTPTELKKRGEVVAEPDFFTLCERLIERVWALGSLYQGWPTQTGFAHLLDTAKEVRTIEWNWARTEVKRRSSRSGTVHSIGGFTGSASFRGSVGRLLPLLEIGRWTGVGRQTVWGKGELRIAEFTPEHRFGQGG